MLNLVRDDQIAETFEEGLDMLKQKFFLPAPPVDLSDIYSLFFTSPPQYLMIITKLEVMAAIRRLKPDTAPGSDGIPNRMKACSEKLVELLTLLFQACVEQVYYPRAFKTANTITLK